MAQFTIPARDKTTEMRFQMGYALADLAAEHPRIVAVDADLRTSSGLHIFEHFHPDKLVKVGIAEQNLMAISAGLSQEGYIPFPCTFDAFCRRLHGPALCHGGLRESEREGARRLRRPVHRQGRGDPPER